MKISALVSAVIGLIYWNAAAQTADQWVNQGVSNLGAENITAANSAFAEAVIISPTNEPANAYYAASRLLVLATQPAGSNFLTRLGFPVAGRDIYAWDSAAPKDANGLILAPNGVDASEFTAQARTNLLPAIAGAITNLATITDTNFTLNLPGSETDIGSATVDYGDLKLIQAQLWGLEYFIYTLNAQNLNVQLTALRSLYTSGSLTAGQMLAAYPQLFTFATTNDLQNALVAFTNGTHAYFVASDFIRSRPAGEIRLFNYDQVSAKEEAGFRLTLQDLADSLLIGPQFLSIDPNLTVDLTSQFDDPASWRSLLPKFDGDAIELGSFPDLTFGGLVDGLAESSVESFVGQFVKMLPVASAPKLLAGNSLGLTFTTLTGDYYVLESSTNLANWQIVTNFTAMDVSTTVVDSHLAGLSQRFYRLRDDTGFLTYSGVVLDQNTSQPIANAEVYSAFDGTATFTDAGGSFYLLTSLPSSYYYDYLEISAPGYAAVNNYFGGNGGLTSGLVIYLAKSAPPVGITITGGD
jgi:hypothetical protein